MGSVSHKLSPCISVWLYNVTLQCGSHNKAIAKWKSIQCNITFIQYTWENLVIAIYFGLYLVSLWFSTDADLGKYWWHIQQSPVHHKDSFPWYYHPAARFITTRALDMALINQCSTPHPDMFLCQRKVKPIAMWLFGDLFILCFNGKEPGCCQDISASAKVIHGLHTADIPSNPCKYIVEKRKHILQCQIKSLLWLANQLSTQTASGLLCVCPCHRGLRLSGGCFLCFYSNR